MGKTDSSQSCWCSICPGVVAGPACALPCPSAPLSACSCAAAVSAPALGTWVSVHRRVTHPCHSSHASDSSCSLRRQQSSSGSTAAGANCATGLLFLLLAKGRCASGMLLSLSAAAGYIPEGTARGQCGQPPAAGALVSSPVLVLSTLLCRLIPAQSKPQELLSFARLSCCPWLMAAHGQPQLAFWWEPEQKGHQTLLVGILRGEEMLM